MSRLLVSFSSWVLSMAATWSVCLQKKRTAVSVQLMRVTTLSAVLSGVGPEGVSQLCPLPIGSSLPATGLTIEVPVQRSENRGSLLGPKDTYPYDPTVAPGDSEFSVALATLPAWHTC